MAPKAKVLSFPDLFGGKLCAALDRQHPRPMVELLNPNFKDILDIFRNEFIGMTRVPVTLQELRDARDQLVKKIQSDLTNDERNFILSIKELRPEWVLLGVGGVEALPAVQWKLQNLRLMNTKKHAEAIGKLKQCLEL